MFISIMSGVIGEVTRQPPATPAPRPAAAATDPQAARARPSKRRPPSRAPARTALPGKYRVLAESFRRAAGFHA